MLNLVNPNLPVSISKRDIILIGVGRNEIIRLPSFLAHYRSLGVTRFCLVDNNSTDESRQLLKAQPDVYLWTTSQSYGMANCGHDWIRELLKICVGNWCVVADLDEYFVYPKCQNMKLGEFAAQLTAEGSTAVSSILVDMYSKNALSANSIDPNQHPLNICQYFDPIRDTDNLHHPLRGLHPIHSKGGMRKRIFQIEPCLNKITFFHNLPGTHLLQGAHYIDGVTFSSTSCATLHFKYLQEFSNYVSAEALREEHFGKGVEYKVYSEILNKNPGINAFYEYSTKLTNIDLFLESEFFVADKSGMRISNHDVSLGEENCGSMVHKSISFSQIFCQFHQAGTNHLTSVLEISGALKRPILIFALKERLNDWHAEACQFSDVVVSIEVTKNSTWDTLLEDVRHRYFEDPLIIFEAVNRAAGKLWAIKDVTGAFINRYGKNTKFFVDITNAALFHEFSHDRDHVDYFFGKTPSFGKKRCQTYFVSVAKKSSKPPILNFPKNSIYPRKSQEDLYRNVQANLILLASAMRAVLTEWGFELAEHFCVTNALTVFHIDKNRGFHVQNRIYISLVEKDEDIYCVDHSYFNGDNLIHDLSDLASALGVVDPSYSSVTRVLKNNRFFD
ncbi:glycosyltransferase family 2 protein [Burkholderia sp. LMU1-1-1.1]|uniref:glycosyltransferase family 2 protein n=1 Tax=Burkholderia sp. LMU1-1-1.1 TaxID=3135266 RepID=UPI00341E95B5